MAQPRVVVEDIDPIRGLPEYIDDFTELCQEEFNKKEIKNRISVSTQVILVYENDELVTFGLVTPYTTGDYLTLELLCGSYKTGGKYPWKGSELVVDKAIQLARQYKKNAVRLKALNEYLLENVYRPMGFKDIPGQKRHAEIRPLPMSGGVGDPVAEEAVKVAFVRAQRNPGALKDFKTVAETHRNYLNENKDYYCDLVRSTVPMDKSETYAKEQLSKILKCSDGGRRRKTRRRKTKRHIKK